MIKVWYSLSDNSKKVLYIPLGRLVLIDGLTIHYKGYGDYHKSLTLSKEEMQEVLRQVKALTGSLW